MIVWSINRDTPILEEYINVCVVVITPYPPRCQLWSFIRAPCIYKHRFRYQLFGQIIFFRLQELP